MNYGIQLYSVRDMAEVDYEKTLREVAALGYEFVEPAGFFGHSAQQVKAWLDQYGLKVSGTHSSFGDLEEDFAGTVAYHKAIGNTRYIVPGVDTSSRLPSSINLALCWPITALRSVIITITGSLF